MEDLVCEIEDMYRGMFVKNWVGTIFLPECGTLCLCFFLDFFVKTIISQHKSEKNI